MRIRHRTSLLPPLMVMLVVTMLLLFFYSDTTYQRHGQSPRGHHSAGQSGQSDRKILPQRSLSNPRQHDVVTSTSLLTSGPRHVIVVSVARSGSSFTGDVISHGADVYYVFEPLRRAQEVLVWEPSRNRSSVAGQDDLLENGWRKQAPTILQHFLSCDFNDLDLSLLDPSFLHRYARTKLLGKCIMAHANGTDTSGCVQLAEQQCRRTKTRLVKTIRVPFRDLEPLLKNDPDLLLILLVRDPRASLWSRVNAFTEERHPQGYDQFFYEICNSLEDDVTAITELNRRFPGRMKILRYETLAEEPIQISKLLYRYLGLEWNRHAENRIRSQTSSAKLRSKSLTYSVKRQDSALAARAWRLKVYWSFVQVVQKQCFGVMRRLGYSLFRLEDDLRDTAFRTYDSEQVEVDQELLLQ